ECSWCPRLEMFSRGKRPGWTAWGNQADETYEPTWDTYKHNSATERRPGPLSATEIIDLRQWSRDTALELERRRKAG
ncbi:MAG TPA: hypothetical protein VM326_00770, partial [Sphingomicrobium sp.]|nr:hypothetical protein [Sphingomicrobium sp.]